MKTLRFALLGLWREWRGGDLRLLGLALVLAVASVTSVGFFTDRVEGALQHQGNELLAADLVVESPDPVPQAFSDQALRLGLGSSHSLSFPSIIPGDSGPQLVQVKAVDGAYPLRGQLLLRYSVDAPPVVAKTAPAFGRIRVEPRLLAVKKQPRALRPGCRRKVQRLQ